MMGAVRETQAGEYTQGCSVSQLMTWWRIRCNTTIFLTTRSIKKLRDSMRRSIQQAVAIMGRFRTKNQDYQSQPPPYLFKGVVLRTFILKAQYDALAEVCAEFLNSVAIQHDKEFRWTPLMSTDGSGLVMLQIVTYEHMSSLHDPDLGYTTQKECIFSIPIVQENPAGVPVDMAMYAPYCFVDNDWSVIGGREVLGYPKLDGWFDISEDPDDYGIQVEANVMAQLTKNCRLEKQPVVVIERDNSLVAPAFSGQLQGLWPFGPVDELYKSGICEVEDDRILDSLSRHAGISQPAVALKQFRDPVIAEVACYQALMGFMFNIKKFHGSNTLPLAPISLPEYDSLRIARNLGLGHSPTPVWAHWYKADFTLTDAEALSATPTLGAAYENPLTTDGFGQYISDVQGLYSQMARSYIDLTTQWWKSWLQPPL